ncbi:MAG: type I methionyl aminopeptidase [Planctomycetota bacterium]|jgi:methionyl aminopeptidase
MVVTATADIQAAEAAAQRVVETHERLVEFVRAGMTMAEVDSFVGQTLESLGARSAFHRYRIPGHPPFPSQSCLSKNECIVHGTHMQEGLLEPGDVFSIDIGVVHQGFIGDAAWTYAIESADEEALSLMRCGRESLRRGVEAMQPGRPLMDWARAVQGYVEKECGYALVRGLGGHGYGRKLHGPPFVSNVVPRTPGEWPDQWKLFETGMLIAVEPMLATGTNEIRTTPRDWPIYTADGSLSVHYEADVLITAEGPRNLTMGLFELPEVVAG